MSYWSFKTNDGIDYTFPSTAVEFDSALIDFESYLGIDSAAFLEFINTLNVSECRPFDSTIPQPPTEQDDPAALTDEQQLAKAKSQKIKEIDGRTSSLISGGFEYPAASGLMFGFSTQSQANILALYNVRNEAQLTYPVRYNTQDDTGAYDLADADDIMGFFLTAVAVMRGTLDSGTALKDEVRIAETVEEVEAIEDAR